MSAPSRQPSPTPDQQGFASVHVADNTATITVGGRWRLRANRPTPEATLAALTGGSFARLVFVASALDDWDSSLVLFLRPIREFARERQIPSTIDALPAALRQWLDLVAADTAATTTPTPAEWFPITRRIGRWTQGQVDRARVMVHFLGECALGAGRIFTAPGAFRWADAIFQMRRCGARALGIVGLITFLVGVILAFIGATQFRQVGADVFVADLVGLAIFREMGPMMAAIVLAGRTGAAYAAELGNMRLNEEIDALETFGLRPLDFLVMPRLLALVLMMPLLTLYANFLGVIGGMVVCETAINMNALTYFHRLQEAVGLNDLGTGLLKSLFFGAIVAYAGCLKGMRAGRSAVGVGEAATSAVVLGILLIIITDAVFTILFNALRW